MSNESRGSFSRQVFGLAGWLTITFCAAALGAAASINAGSFYAELVRPSWSPPAWLVWRAHGLRRARIALIVFVIQLAANALWSWLFFAWRQGGFAFADIVLLWILIVATIVAFLRLQRLAAALLLPYLAWVSFAALLNFSIWQLNAANLG